MNIRSAIRLLFVAPARSELPRREVPSAGGAAAIGAAAAADTSQGGQPASPVFLTPQSLVSFPGAALAINILWNLVFVLNKQIGKQAFVPVVIAFGIGAIIYFVSLSDKMTKKDKAIGAVIAFINAAWLGLNALGITIGPPE